MKNRRMGRYSLFSKRLIGLVLCVAMIATLIPATVFSVAAGEDSFSFVITNKGNPINGASVKISNAEFAVEYERKTGSNGTVSFAEFTSLAEEHPDLEMDYEISLDGYFTKTGKISAANGNESGQETVALEKDAIEGISVTGLSRPYEEGKGAEEAVTVSGTIEGDIVTYSTDGGETYVQTAPTIDKPNELKVKVKVERTGYTDPFISEEVTAKVTKVKLTDSDVKIENPYNNTQYNASYEGKTKTVIRVSSCAKLTKDGIKHYDVSYSDDGESFSPVAPSILLVPGEIDYTVKVTPKDGFEDIYEEYTKKVKVSIVNGTIEGITVHTYGDNKPVAYDEEEHDAVTAIDGIKDGDVVKYYLTKNALGEAPNDALFETTVPTVETPGFYYVYVKVIRTNYDDHVIQVPGLLINIEKDDIKDINVTAYEGTYDREEHNAVMNVSGTREGDVVTYSTDGTTYSTNVPKVKTVSDSKEVYIKIHRNNNYNDLIIKKNVVVKKATQHLVLDDINITYNTSGELICSVQPLTDYDGTEEITYAKVSGSTGISIDAAGKITYSNTGSMRVRATKAESGNYKEATVECNVNVSYLETPENPYSMNDEDFKAEDGTLWYKSDVTISPAEGFKIIKGSKEVGSIGTDAITESEENVYDDYKIALVDSTGCITDLIDVPEFAIDKTAPVLSGGENKPISFELENDSTLERILHFMTFGLFFNERIKVTVDCHDEPTENSGIKEISIFTKADGESTYSKVTEKDGENVFFIDPELRGCIYYTIQDNAGNENGTELNPNLISCDNSNLLDEAGFVMLEQTAPELSDIIDMPNTAVNPDVKCTAAPAHVYSTDDFCLSFDSKDAESGLNNIEVTVNGENCDEIQKFISVNNGAFGTIKAFNDTIGEGEGHKIENKKFSFIIDMSVLEEQIKPDIEEGSYIVVVKSFDNAGNVSEKSVIIYEDKTAPVITSISFDGVNNREDVREYVSLDDYGFFFKEDVKVTITADDIRNDYETSVGVKTISYAIVGIDENDVPKEEKATVEVDESNSITVDIHANFKGQIYAYATDNLDNSSVGGNELPSADKYSGNDQLKYIDEETENEYNHMWKPAGTIIENQEAHDKTASIVISVPETPYHTTNGDKLFNKDIEVGIEVTDSYSGIYKIEWEVYSPNVGKTEGSYTVNVNEGNESRDTDAEWDFVKREDLNLVHQMKRNIAIVNRDDNDIVVRVKMTDNAGNCIINGNTDGDGWAKSETFAIDTTAPKIEISYDNNSPDSQYTDFYKENRTATIVITERNFDTSCISYYIKNADNTGFKTTDLSNIANWHKEGNWNGTTYTAKVPFDVDGDYTFDIDCTDLAGNKGNDIEEQKFTIDKTLPVVTVTYDNNSARNGNYYKADRTATITIKEHNFDAARVKVIGTSTKTAFPVLNGWTNNGDTHTATIKYSADSYYTFDIESMDKAGNASADYVQDTFFIDKTAPELSITGINDESANADSGNIGFVITATDENFDGFTPVLTGVIMSNGNFSTQSFKIGSYSNIKNGATYTVKNITADGIYYITCTLVDKAGNEYKEVLIQNTAGAKEKVKRCGNDRLVNFSVNREGSTFYVDSFTSSLLNSFYVKNVNQNVVITEINPDEIKAHSISLNGNELSEGKDYTVSLDKSGGSWHKYTYSINRNVFDNEGEYNVVVSSKDKAENEAFSDVKDLSVKFVADRTAPIVSVSGMVTNGRYQTDKQRVIIIPSDDGGMLKSIVIYTVDEYGNELKELINLSGDELIEALEEGDLEFTLDEGLYQNVKIVCTDKAGNTTEDDVNDTYYYKNVSVSSSAFMIFWANKPLRWSVIGIIIAVIGAAVALIIVKSRKKQKNV